VAAQNLRHRECQQLGDLGDGGGNATTISLGGSSNNNNSGAFKRKASAAIAAADDDDDDTQVVDRDDSWWAYLLLSANSRKTYVGVSSNVVRRLRQHNGELAGGAKAARAGRPWHLACTVGSFSTRSQACQFEWRWKKYSKSSSRGMDKAVVAGDLPLSAPPQKLVELPVILRRWTALMQARNEVQEWKQVQVEWHSQE
jgi:predicted GIY-YIG superfamily endonuclease